MYPTGRSLSSPHRILLIGLLTIAAMGLGRLLAEAHTGHEAPVASPDAACVAASPQATNGTPAAEASPAAQPGDAPNLGTPIAGPCLTVTLQADGTTAGPRQLIVTIVTPNGAPVTDGTVTVSNRHLGMDHGISTYEAVADEPGRYAVGQAAMGMGGTWQVDVTITRPGYVPVTVTFHVVLEGPV